MKSAVSKLVVLAVLSSTLFSIMLYACLTKWSETEKGEIRIVTNRGGQTLGYSSSPGVKILTVNRLAFKDLNKNGVLDPYEDWRLTTDERAKDLASKMSVYQIAGLMLYSGHQAIPGGGIYQNDTYNGKPYKDSGARPYALSDGQKDFITNDNLRHVLITSVENPEVAARWNNNIQALSEGISPGIPVNTSSDPRHEAASDAEYALGSGGEISRWPGAIGLAATFDPELVKRFGEIASIEYRALGIATALSPQIDIATDPRWYRFKGTFGPDPELSTDMAMAYIDGFQTSSGESVIRDGWGFESVNAMAKHWPGGGSGEGGRDAHFGFGKFAVYPGKNIQTHMDVFLKGAFNLVGGTKTVSAIMPYYTISFNQNPEGENVGNAFSRYFITDLLRNKYGFDGVVCTDWGVTRDDAGMAVFGQTPWGVENLSVSDRHYRVLMAGGDQFGGNNDAGPVIEAYEKGVKEYGEKLMRERFEKSAVRLLRNIFRVGLFENPYLDIEKTKATVGKAEFMRAGYEAQVRSVVMLKNRNNCLPLNKNNTIYIPMRHVPESTNFWGQKTPAKWERPISIATAKRYFNITYDPGEADAAIVVINSPDNGPTQGYNKDDKENGGNGFIPISLQYGEYTALEARETSLAGDGRETDVLNRSYKGKTVIVNNSSDLKLIMDVRALMKNKPVIVVVRMSNPTIVKEFEKDIDALLINFDVQDQAILDIISGNREPSGLLPLQMPADMTTVEKQAEDLPFDMDTHVDSEGNRYDFGFGMNWQGVIRDKRTERYSVKHN